MDVSSPTNQLNSKLNICFFEQDIDPDKQDSGDNDEKEVSGLLYLREPK